MKSLPEMTAINLFLKWYQWQSPYQKTDCLELVSPPGQEGAKRRSLKVMTINKEQPSYTTDRKDAQKKIRGVAEAWGPRIMPQKSPVASTSQRSKLNFRG